MSIAYLGYKIDSTSVALAEKRLDSMAISAGAAERSAVSLGTAMGKAFAAIGGLMAGGQFIRTISDFGGAMSAVKAVTGATGAELAAMRDIAKDLGATTEFSATQAAEGLKFLGMAGFSASEAIQSIPATLDLATAGAMSLGAAADIASNVLSGFQMEASEAGRVADVLAKAASSSNTSLSQLGSAMSYAAPVAKSFGISIESASAAIGVMSDAGIQGERAGTGLRGALAALAAPSKDASSALKALGLTVNDINPATNSLSDIFARLKTSGMTASEAIRIFGRENASAALVMSDASQRMREFTGELQNADGAATNMANTMRDNLKGDLAGLGSAVSAVSIALGDAGLTSIIRGMVQILTTAIRAIGSAIEYVGDLRGYLIAAGVAAAVRFAPSMMTAAGGVYSLVTSLKFLRGALISTGIGALIVGAGMLINEFIELTEKTGSFSGALTALKDISYEALGRIVDGYKAMRHQINAAFLGLASDFMDMLASITSGAGKWANVFIGLHVAPIAAIKEAWNALPDFFSNLGGMVSNAFLSGIEFMVNGAIKGINKIISGFNGLMSMFGADRAAEWFGISTKLALIPEMTLEKYKTSVPEAANIGARMAEAFTDAASATYVGESGSITNAIKSTADDLYFAADAAKVMGQELWAGATAPLQSIQTLNEKVSDTEKTATDAASSAADLDQELAGVGSTGTAAGGAASKGVKKVGEAAKKAAKNAKTLTDELKDILESSWDKLVDQMMGGFKDGFSGVVDLFKNMIAQMAITAAMNPIKLGFASVMGSAGTAMAGSAAGSAVGGSIGTSILGGAIGQALGGIGAFGGQVLLGAQASIASLMSTGVGGMFTTIGSAAANAGIATTLGAAIPPLLAVAAAFSFFSTKTKVLDSGIRLSIGSIEDLTAMVSSQRGGGKFGTALSKGLLGLTTSTQATMEDIEAIVGDDGILVQTFKKVEKSRFWGLSKSRSTRYEIMGEGAQSIINAIGDIQDGLEAAAAVFGIAGDTFDDFTAQVKVSTKGLSEEDAIQALNDAMKEIGNQFADMIPNLEQYKKEGEASADTVIRLATSLGAVNGMLTYFNKTLMDISTIGAAASSDLIDLFGGLQNFNAAHQGYLQSFYSQSEQATMLSAELARQFSELGTSFPKTKDEFRALVDSLNLSTEAGREMYAALLSLSPQFAQLVTLQDQLNQEMERTAQLKDEEIKQLGRTRFETEMLLAASRRGEVEIARAQSGAVLSQDLVMRSRGYSASGITVDSTPNVVTKGRDESELLPLVQATNKLLTKLVNINTAWDLNGGIGVTGG